MNGGFTDFRTCPYAFQKSDSLDSNNGTPSLSSSSRSTSYDSGDALVEPHITKPARRFVKIPKKGLMAVIGHLSPQLSKKLLQAEKNQTPAVSRHPVWPPVMTTYGRGISTSPIQNMMEPPVPSLTAMKAQALLDERREVRTALQLLVEKISQQRPEKALNSCYTSEEDLNDPPKYEDLPIENNIPSENIVLDEEVCKDLMRFNITSTDAFPINPEISVLSTAETPDDPPGGEIFQDESVFEALDLDSMPTITPEELAGTAVNEVRNVHVVCDYIVLETGPPSESVFV